MTCTKLRLLRRPVATQLKIERVIAMFKFDFQNPTKILFGEGRIGDITAQIDKGHRVLITYGGGSIKKNGVLDQVKAALTDYTLFEFAGIEPNPSYETLMQAVQLIQQEEIDYILAVGGGSVIDGSKFIAAAVNFRGDPWDLLAKQAAVESALPFGCILTLPATGSEMNSGAVIPDVLLRPSSLFPILYCIPNLQCSTRPRPTLCQPRRSVMGWSMHSFMSLNSI